MVAWLGCMNLLTAFDARLGQPLVTHYQPEEYGADTQNWAAVQDQQGLLYVANNAGILEFDGQEWRLIPINDSLSARSLAVDRRNRIFVGALGDFGILEGQRAWKPRLRLPAGQSGCARHRRCGDHCHRG